MKKISFNEGTLSFDKNKVTYEVPLEKTNINFIEEVQFIKGFPFMIPIVRLEITQNNTFFLMELEVENGFLPLGVFKTNSTDEQKYQFIKQLCEIAIELKNIDKLVTVLDDRNILVNIEKQEIKFLYRGIQGLMPAGSYNDENIETQVKRLALFVLTSARYDELRINGLDEGLNKTSQERFKLVSKIAHSKTINEILFHIEQLYLEENKKLEEIVDKPKKHLFSKVKNDIEEKVSKLNKPKKGQKVNHVKREEKIIKEKSNKTSRATFENESKAPFINASKLKMASGIVIGVVLIVFVISIFSNGQNSEPVNTTLAASQKDNDYLLNGLQYAAIQDYDSATKSFEKIETPFEKLNGDNQKAILFSYLMTGKYQAAIEVEPDFSYSVINYLVSKDDLGVVKDIDSKEPVIIFEKASINKEYEIVLKYKDDVKLDGRRESLVVDAYIGLNKLDEALEFAKSKGNKDLMAKIEVIKSQKLNEENKQKEQKEELKNENSGEDIQV